MKVIVGLGNPGEKYTLTRHNIGFLAVDHLAKELLAVPIKPNRTSLLMKVVDSVQKETLILSKPQTYMNLSGKAVEEIKNFYQLTSSDFLIINDDFYLEFGKVKLLPGGGDGGHNGLKSIFSITGKKIPRLRVGVGPRDQTGNQEFSNKLSKLSLDRYVLGKFSKQEQQEIPKYLDFILKVCVDFLKHGINDAMNRFNKRSYQDY